MSRPSGYSGEIAEAICDRLAIGESLRSICRDEGMPSVTSVMRWLNTNLAFREQYAGARELQAEYRVDEIVEIADKSDADDPVKVNRARLRIDTRKWAASKLAPKKYGDQAKITHAGDAENPVALVQITDEMRVRALASFLAKTKAKVD